MTKQTTLIIKHLMCTCMQIYIFSNKNRITMLCKITLLCNLLFLFEDTISHYKILSAPVPVVILPQGTFVNIWRHFWLSQGGATSRQRPGMLLNILQSKLPTLQYKTTLKMSRLPRWRTLPCSPRSPPLFRYKRFEEYCHYSDKLSGSVQSPSISQIPPRISFSSNLRENLAGILMGGGNKASKILQHMITLTSIQIPGRTNRPATSAMFSHMDAVLTHTADARKTFLHLPPHLDSTWDATSPYPLSHPLVPSISEMQ